MTIGAIGGIVFVAVTFWLWGYRCGYQDRRLRAIEVARWERRL